MVSLPVKSVTWTKVSLKLRNSCQRCLFNILFLKNQVDIRSEDVGNAEDVLTLSDLGTERDSSFLGGSNLLGGLWIFMSVPILFESSRL